jgi:hypothetical protein
MNLIGATQSITVRLRYEKILPLLGGRAGPLLIIRIRAKDLFPAADS